LFSAGYIFVAMVFKFFQNRIPFRYNGIKFFIQLLVHLFLHDLINGFENAIGLAGKKLLHFFSLSQKASSSLSLSLIGETPWTGVLVRLVWAWETG
jgi:hypothetical protein